MHWFTYKNNVLHVDDVPLPAIAEDYGTPTFIYSRTTLDRHIETIDGAFNDIDHMTCFSVKANSTGGILKMFAEKGLGADIVSGGELFRALRAGFKPDTIVYSGVGKTPAEIAAALDAGIFMFNVESEAELLAINRVAGEKGVKAPISFRVNPAVDPKTHPYTATGLKKSKFGVPQDRAVELYVKAAGLANIEVIGIDAHIGSQLTDLSPYREAVERLAGLVKDVRTRGINLKIFDIGGGLGINYDDSQAPDPKTWAEMVVPVVKETGCRLFLEPGRSIVGNAGILLTKVIYTKENDVKTFVITDGGMNDVMRPTLYGSHHTILPVSNAENDSRVVDVVGPICESGDFLAQDRSIAMPGEGDYLAVMSAGAYGMTMSSNYNSRPRAAEVMVDGSDVTLLSRRESYEDLIAREEV